MDRAADEVRLIEAIEPREGERAAWVDDATQQQRESIEQQVAASTPLVSALLDMQSLAAEYSAADSAEYFAKARELATRFGGVRRVRGDGNCFYRALLFALLERAVDDDAELSKLAALADLWNERLVKQLGFPEMTTSDFCENFASLVEAVGADRSVATVEKLMGAEHESNYYLVFMRLVASGYLQTHADRFGAFVDGGRSVAEYCRSEVDPSNRDCDHLTITALTEALDVPLRVEYMDRTAAPSGGWHHDFGAGDQARSLHFLYRPGHYDILYRQQ